MKFATGDYIVVYDAEDVPEPDQLKKPFWPSIKQGEGRLCPGQAQFLQPIPELLTRIFTADIHSGLISCSPVSSQLTRPIPLGGTSNHFRTKDLIKLKGWDSST